MQSIECTTHGVSIIVFEQEDNDKFSDDSHRDVVIFQDSKVGPYLKRFILNECDDNCLIVKDVYQALRKKPTVLEWIGNLFS